MGSAMEDVSLAAQLVSRPFWFRGSLHYFPLGRCLRCNMATIKHDLKPPREEVGRKIPEQAGVPGVLLHPLGMDFFCSCFDQDTTITNTSKVEVALDFGSIRF